MMQPKYRDVWSKRIGKSDEKPDPQIQHTLELLDPSLLTDCVKCGSKKRKGDFVCSGCAATCPDPDHRERASGFSEIQPPMCEHCAGFLQDLDLPCLGRPKSCSYPPCLDARDSGSSSNSCHGKPKIREGFFVYQLETGYIGMTCNPSQRQVEHEAAAYVDRAERKRAGTDDPIRDVDAYTSKVSSDWVEGFSGEYAKHWSEVRKANGLYQEERKIKWLSPVLPSRQTAWRCEWALKYYFKGSSPFGRSRFEEITKISSLPLLRLESAGLSYAPDSETLLFGLKWRLSGDLGPSQIIPVRFYEVEQWDTASKQWVQIVGNLYPTPVSGKDEVMTESYEYPVSNTSGCSWRVRAVNDVGIPGPWAELVISAEEMDEAMSRFLRVTS